MPQAPVEQRLMSSKCLAPGSPLFDVGEPRRPGARRASPWARKLPVINHSSCHPGPAASRRARQAVFRYGKSLESLARSGRHQRQRRLGGGARPSRRARARRRRPHRRRAPGHSGPGDGHPGRLRGRGEDIHSFVGASWWLVSATPDGGYAGPATNGCRSTSAVSAAGFPSAACCRGARGRARAQALRRTSRDAVMHACGAHSRCWWRMRG
jgi:hypothetical protein